MEKIEHAVIPSTPKLAISFAGSGPLVIFVHGLGGDRRTWDEQLKGLAPHYTAVSVDLRGYGDSDDPPTPLQFKEDFCADLETVMNYFNVDKAHLIGLSMGGRVCRSTTLQIPHRVASLTLANTSPGFDHLTPEQLQTFVQARSGVIKDGCLPANFGLQQAKTMMAKDASERAVKIMVEALGRLKVKNYLEVLKASTLQDRGDSLENIKCPVLIITSDNDPVYPDEITQKMVARIPHAALSCISNSGHISNLEQPDSFNKTIIKFLNSLPPERAACRAYTA